MSIKPVRAARVTDTTGALLGASHVRRRPHETRRGDSFQRLHGFGQASCSLAKGAAEGLRAPGRHLRDPKEKRRRLGDSFQRLHGFGQASSLAKGAAEGLRAPGRPLRDPKEKRRRPASWRCGGCRGDSFQRLHGFGQASCM